MIGTIIKLFVVFTIAIDVEAADTVAERQSNGKDMIIEGHCSLAPQLYEERALEVDFAIKKVKRAFKTARRQFSYGNVLISVLELKQLAEDPSMAHHILNQKAIDRIILPNLQKQSNDIKKHLLMLMNTLLQGDRERATEVVHPNNVIDILTVFETSENEDVQKQALQVLHLWLPGNPNAQTVLAQFRSLDDFYRHMQTLQPELVQSLLELFIKILKEHMEARSKLETTKEDRRRLKLYQRIGLLERMRMPRVCKGLLGIYRAALTQAVRNHMEDSKTDLMPSIFKLLILTKKFCIEPYKNIASPLFKQMKRHMEDTYTREYLAGLDVNMTEVEAVIEVYIKKVKVMRSHPDEL